jgi:hypothetical protein
MQTYISPIYRLNSPVEIWRIPTLRATPVWWFRTDSPNRSIRSLTGLRAIFLMRARCSTWQGPIRVRQVFTCRGRRSFSRNAGVYRKTITGSPGTFLIVWHYNRQNNIDENGRSNTEKGKQYPDNSDSARIPVEIFCETSANTEKHFIPRFCKPCHSTGFNCDDDVDDNGLNRMIMVNTQNRKRCYNHLNAGSSYRPAILPILAIPAK